MLIRAFLTDTRGQTTIEYALIGTLILAVCAAGIQGMAAGSVDDWNYIASTIENAAGYP